MGVPVAKKRKNVRIKTLLFLFLILGLSLFVRPLSFSLPAEKKISPALRALVQERGPQDRYKVWVYFHDKGPRLEERMGEVKASLPLRALKRRGRHRDFYRLVDFYDVPVYENYVAKIQALGFRLRHRSRWLNALSAEVRGADLRTIAGLPFVQKIDPVRSFVVRDPLNPPHGHPETSGESQEVHLFDYGPSLNQVSQINVPALHDLGLSGRGILICMLDTGFNPQSHQALAHLDILGTWDFVNNDPNVFDEAGQMGNGNHGTQTLGTIAGFFPGELVGPAYGASFLLGKTENTTWERHIEEDHWVAGAEWADRWGADIISSSLGYRDRFTHGESDYDAADMDGQTTAVSKGANIAASRGILLINSAGNEGRSTSMPNTIIAPADSVDVLAVGAVDASGRRVTFSSFGPTADGRIKPDIMAQGQEVYTVSTESSTGYQRVAGTSFSCPLAAGAAALILQANPTWTNQDIITALKQTAQRSSSPDNLNGWGLLDARNAAFYPLKRIYPPRAFAVKRLENNYGFFRQYVDRLAWEVNPRNGGNIHEYRLYAKRLEQPGAAFELIATFTPQTFHFDRRGLLADETFLYKITAVSQSGEESDPDYARL